MEPISAEEEVTGDELAPDSFCGANGTSKTETASAFIGITVLPADDLPVITNRESTEIDNVDGPLVINADRIRGGKSFVIVCTPLSFFDCFLLTRFPSSFIARLLRYSFFAGR